MHAVSINKYFCDKLLSTYEPGDWHASPSPPGGTQQPGGKSEQEMDQHLLVRTTA